MAWILRRPHLVLKPPRDRPGFRQEVPAQASHPAHRRCPCCRGRAFRLTQKGMVLGY